MSPPDRRREVARAVFRRTLNASGGYDRAPRAEFFSAVVVACKGTFPPARSQSAGIFSGHADRQEAYFAQVKQHGALTVHEGMAVRALPRAQL